LDNPFEVGSRSQQLFEVLANAERPMRPEEIAAGIGETNGRVAHTMLKTLRARGVTVLRYQDPQGSSPTSSLYSLHPVEGYTELRTQPRARSSPAAASPPTPVWPGVRQPRVGSIARVTALFLQGDELKARFDCDDTIYTGTVAAAQPTVGEWLTVVTIGLHGQGLYVDLAGGRVVTIENLAEEDHGR
jgi:hypothetical protein